MWFRVRIVSSLFAEGYILVIFVITSDFCVIHLFVQYNGVLVSIFLFVI